MVYSNRCHQSQKAVPHTHSTLPSITPFLVGFLPPALIPQQPPITIPSLTRPPPLALDVHVPISLHKDPRRHPLPFPRRLPSLGGTVINTLGRYRQPYADRIRACRWLGASDGGIRGCGAEHHACGFILDVARRRGGHRGA